MRFKEGEEVEGAFCPKCGAKLFYEMSFTDCFDHRTGHYTRDYPIIACERCNYAVDVEPSEDFEE